LLEQVTHCKYSSTLLVYLVYFLFNVEFLADAENFFLFFNLSLDQIVELLVRGLPTEKYRVLG
jgi:hypothetical protein